MTNLSNIIDDLPRMKSGDELLAELKILPEYIPGICNADAPVRLMALSDLYRIYLPSQMSLEIYSKLYLALLRSMQKKGTKLAVQQQNQNYRAIMQQEYSGIMGGSDSFTIIGTSGIGKSSAISRAINMITENRVIETENPYTRVVPCVIVQCPFDSSVKGLLLEVLRKVDEVLDSKYYQNALRARATTDMLIGSVSQVALNYIGMLVVDEIQNVANSKNGKSLIGALTQLINNSGISICMVGTPESTRFFESAMQLARRSVGLQYTTMSHDAYFQEFCKVMFSYQYTQKKTKITDGILEWLYEHSAGVTSVVVALIHDAQEIAILNGKEVLNLESLNEAITRNLPMEKVVEKHTMFPYYGRFLPRERRTRAFQALVSMAGNYRNLLAIPQSKNGKARYLRYCPLCAAHDRKQYGEAYWHRIHQMIGTPVCPVHGCYLVDSIVIISGKAAPSLTTAEEVIPLSESCIFSDNKQECDVAAYLAEVFQADVDLESEVTVGEYLHSRMANTPYRSIRGEQRNIVLFHSDFMEFYRDLPDNWFTELWQLQGDGTTRPKKVTVFAVEKMLHLPGKRISLYLPKCLTEIQRYRESQEQYWAREIIWAVCQVESTGATLTWRKVRDLANMRCKDFEACLPYIADYADSELTEQIRQL